MTRRRETLVGAAVLAVLLTVIVSNALEGGEDARPDGYEVRAVFQRTDGLTVGAQVRMAGIPVGSVVEQELDERYRAHVTLRVRQSLEIPADTAAIIETDGLLGGKYIELQPGGDEAMLQPGGRIDYTQDSMVIEDLLARIVAQAKAQRGEGEAEAGSEGETGTGVEAGGSSFVPSLLDDMDEGE